MKMKTRRFFLLTMAISALVFFPPVLYGQEEGGTAVQSAANSPEVAPPLVPEGLLAMELAKALNLGQAQNEAEAENLLSAAGIEPRNGWIGDYPVTPDILVEIDQGIAAAADARKLNLDRDAALRAADETAAKLGLMSADAGGPVPPDAAGASYAETPPPSGYSPDPYGTYPAPLPPNEQVVNNYYYNNGPPVVTYYPPPEAYSYLYAWVPYPFWYSSFYFSGFFILHDFHRTVSFHHRPFIISNHAVHPRTRTVFRVDPVTRGRFGRGPVPRVSPPRHFQTPSAQAGARSIVTRSRQGAQPVNPSTSPGARTWGRNSTSGNRGAQQQIRPIQPVNPRFSGGSNINRAPNITPRASGPSVVTVKPIQPSVTERQNAAAQTGPSARGARPSGQVFQPPANLPQTSAGTGNWAGRTSVPNRGTQPGAFTASRGGESPNSASRGRAFSPPSASRIQGSSAPAGRSSGFFGGQRGAGGGMSVRGFSRMR
jgi:hypothetical protein